MRLDFSLFASPLLLECSPLSVRSERLGCFPEPLLLKSLELQFLGFLAPYDVRKLCSAFQLLSSPTSDWKSSTKCWVHLCSYILSKSWTLKSLLPWQLSCVFKQILFFSFLTSFSCYQQACLLLPEVEISNQVTFEHSVII